ncbi:AdoMet-dependent rRNA methyltransferase SPB1 [Angomonas deanei]|uniref:rRNA methyltransferase n=1 Tax=Angomonas deanei TaxID=59799 RepID=A0A7G2CTE1_9TRYP|nr:AdoMet-dependent rRNA methyltransferase SPB1 [Angomonas deanei]CAD2221492.1 FtsJ-like methyltransferase/Domain of unknown function (DUF3381)/Spb1 C-terminal domain containing protein, putative [Angomonas deanei]|eukprot:EPY26747.1 AdoMet-dependent rRNA methyltransferase SPB1 [Angomonas deanei]
MGVKSKKKAKTRLDAYYRLAKDQGYRARSAFKLIQLNLKYDFLAKSRVLVDLCAAPGGWLQVAAKYMPVGSKIVGVDLVPIAPIRGCKTFVGDITDDKTRKMIITWLKKEPVDCVIHDGAPNVGGVWSRDLFDQNALVLCATKMACSMLKPNGWFVTKVFRSQDFHKLLWVFKQLFEKVEATKPLASRMESAEIFVVCAGYKAPKQVDPSMFNAQKVFSDVGEEKILNAAGMLVTPKSNVPMGYDAPGGMIARPIANFSEFIHAEDPKLFLKTHDELRFTSEEDKMFLKSKSSKKELVYLCGDLQQVSDADAKRLIRWRDQLLREQARLLREDDAMDSDEDADSTGQNGGSDNDELQFDWDSKEGITDIAREILELRKRKEKELKKRQKKVVDRKLRQIKGLINYDPTASADQHLDNEEYEQDGEGTAGVDGEEDVDLDAFTVEKLAHLPETDVAGAMDQFYAEHDDDEDRGNAPLNPIDSVNLAAQQDYDFGAGDVEDREHDPLTTHQLVEGEEFFMDVDNYGNYIPAERSSRVKLYEEGFENEEEEDEEFNEEEDESEDEHFDDQEETTGKKKKTAEEKEVKWQKHHRNIDKILRDTFPTPKEDGGLKKKNEKRRRALEEERITMNADAPLVVDGGARKPKRTRFEELSDDDDDLQFSDDDEFERPDLDINEGRADSRKKKQIVQSMSKLTTQELVRQQRKQSLKDNKEIRKQNKRNKNNLNSSTSKKEDKQFEEIPLALTDPEVRARTLAIAQSMLDPKKRRDILDASINKYVYNDDDDLPDWFVKDEQRNCKVILPVTAEEIEAQRERFKQLNARPSRKVMEAIGRKRRKAQRMLHHLLEKGKADPRTREKVGKLSVRTLMRSQAIKGQSNSKKNKPIDNKLIGQMRRDKQRMRREKKFGGKKKR